MLNIKTKIIATIGPASSSKNIISEMIFSGMNVARINMAHCTDECMLKKIIDNVRGESNKQQRHVALLMDLAGPKVRMDLKTENIKIKKNKIYTLGYSKKNDLTINTEIIFKKISSPHGFSIKIDDGKFIFKVLKQGEKQLVLKSIQDCIINNKKGVNFPGIALNISSVTNQDKLNVKLAIKYKIDWIALSFVREHTDIHQITKILRKKKINIPIIAKIEKPEAIKNLDKIIDSFDGALVARGDLGVEMPLAQLPILQKNIIERCKELKKPVIVATQMLESMIENSQPTRAEVNDVANAVYEGSDAVMLSAETSIGINPVNVIKIMADIISVTEKEIFKNDNYYNLRIKNKSNDNRFAIGESVKIISKHLDIKAVVIMTESGRTAEIVSHYRPNKIIYALSSHHHICNQLSMIWGVFPVLTPKYSSTDDMIKKVERLLVSKQLLTKGDTFVMTSGVPVGVTGKTNMLKIHRIK